MSDPDTLTWDKAMVSPYKEDFLEAAYTEIEELTAKGTWYEDLRSNATTKIVPSTWVFRIKRTSDGSIRKFKGHICLRGDLQEDNGESNFSPVAAWPTVRSFLAISGNTRLVDYLNRLLQCLRPKQATG